MNHARRLSSPPRIVPALLCAALLAPVLTTTAQAGPPDAVHAAPLTHAAPARTAPDFAYLAAPYGWRRFSDLCGEGGVLLVFARSDSDLVRLREESPALAAAGITPVAVVGRGDAESWSALERLSLDYRLFSDPGGVVADLYGVPRGEDARTATWWLVDRRLRVLGSAEGVVPARRLADGVAGIAPLPAAIAGPDAAP